MKKLFLIITLLLSTIIIPKSSFAINQDIPPVVMGSGPLLKFIAPYEYIICTGTCTITPPIPSKGYQFCVRTNVNTAAVITLGAIGGSAQYELPALTGYGTAGTGTLFSGGNIGDKICILGVDSLHYMIFNINNTWTGN